MGSGLCPFIPLVPKAETVHKTCRIGGNGLFRGGCSSACKPISTVSLVGVGVEVWRGGGG